jgi:hypothetical protein
MVSLWQHQFTTHFLARPIRWNRPPWPQYNIPAEQMTALVDGTGWTIGEHLRDGADHAVLLRRT